MSNVYFLPWNRIGDFGAWIKDIGAFDHIKERDYTAIKIHFGEKGNKGYIRPEYAKAVAGHISDRSANPFLTDANTIYIGQRADAVHHLKVAAEHGFTLENCGCPVIIADGLRGNSGVDVEVNLRHFKNVSIANAIHFADSLFIMSHFKGHELTGFGGTLKNLGMGCGTRAGKYAMHDELKPLVEAEKCIGCENCTRWCSAHALEVKDKRIVFDTQKCVGCGECMLSCPSNVFSIPWDSNASGVQEKIVEYAYGVLKGKSHFCVNFVNHITKFCDCYPAKGGPLLEDVGVFASEDPVALDQACADAVNRRNGSDFWRHIFPEIDWNVQLDYAQKLGLGTRDYKLLE